MTCDRLVCANCSGPVAEGRCSVCRAERARMQGETPLSRLTPTAVLGLALALVAVALLIQQMTTA